MEENTIINELINTKSHIKSLLYEIVNDIQLHIKYDKDNNIDLNILYWKMYDSIQNHIKYNSPLYDLSFIEYKTIVEKFAYTTIHKLENLQFLINTLLNKDKLDYAYSILSDNESKNVFNWLIKCKTTYAFVGELAWSIYPNNNYIKEHEIEKKDDDYIIGKYIISSRDYEMQDTWIREQYLLKGICEPQKDDIVISAGALYGETSIWFADKVGDKGKVYCFEPSKINLEKLNYNINRNNLNHVIKVINLGLWNNSKKIYLYNKEGSSYCNEFKGDEIINVITLDTFIINENISNINYIKMDIEGGEINALYGAQNTISRFKPNLAISIYHNVEDLYEIPNFIKSIVPEYKFYISHKKNDFVETVLFATIK